MLPGITGSENRPYAEGICSGIDFPGGSKFQAPFETPFQAAIVFEYSLCWVDSQLQRELKHSRYYKASS